LRSTGVRRIVRESKRRPFSAHRSRPRSAPIKCSCSQPAWQRTSTFPSSASQIERLGVQSSCAGQGAVQQGGFLGLDNISVFDRSQPLPFGYKLKQADATGWMAMFALNMALELTHNDRSSGETNPRVPALELESSGPCRRGLTRRRRCCGPEGLVGRSATPRTSGLDGR
jgi:hypothetical protein